MGLRNLHFHARKRGGRGLEPYPARSWGLRMLDAVVYVVGVIGPLMIIPQVWLIYSTHNAAGIAPVTWFTWAAADVPWILYGIVHKEMPITLTYLLWCVGNAAVAIGGLLY